MDIVLIKINPKSSKQPARRACLKCQKKFDSQWIGNRICEPCAATYNSYMEPVQVHYNEYKTYTPENQLAK